MVWKEKKSLLWTLVRVNAELMAALRQPCPLKISLTLPAGVVLPKEETFEYIERPVKSIHLSGLASKPGHQLLAASCLYQPAQMSGALSTSSLGVLNSQFHTKYVTSIITIPTLTTRRRSGTCTPMPAQSVLTKTWMLLQKVSAYMSNYLQCSDPLKKPAITLSLSSLSSSPPIFAISALRGILYLEPSSSHLRRSHPAVRFSISEHFMQELCHQFLISYQADLLLPCPVQKSGTWCVLY